MKKKQIKVMCHGEVRIVIDNEIEVTGDKLELGEDLILADSETTGNHHMLKVIPGVHVWDDKVAEKFFIRPEVDTKVYCKLENRHTDISLPARNTYLVYKAREVDPFSGILRKLRD